MPLVNGGKIADDSFVKLAVDTPLPESGDILVPAERFLGEAGALYDVSSGHNGSCAGASACKAIAGFDGPTGVGSPLGLEAFALPGAPTNTTPPAQAGEPEIVTKLRQLPAFYFLADRPCGHQRDTQPVLDH